MNATELNTIRRDLDRMSAEQLRVYTMLLIESTEKLIDAGDKINSNLQVTKSLIPVLEEGRKRGKSATRLVDATIKSLKAATEGNTDLDSLRPLPDVVYGEAVTTQTYRETEAAMKLIDFLSGKN